MEEMSEEILHTVEDGLRCQHIPLPLHVAGGRPRQQLPANGPVVALAYLQPPLG